MEKQHNDSTAVAQRVNLISASIYYSTDQSYPLKTKFYPEGRLIYAEMVKKFLENIEIILGKAPQYSNSDTIYRSKLFFNKVPKFVKKVAFFKIVANLYKIAILSIIGENYGSHITLILRF